MCKHYVIEKERKKKSIAWLGKSTGKRKVKEVEAQAYRPQGHISFKTRGLTSRESAIIRYLNRKKNQKRKAVMFEPRKERKIKDNSKSINMDVAMIMDTDLEDSGLRKCNRNCIEKWEKKSGNKEAVTMRQ